MQEPGVRPQPASFSRRAFAYLIDAVVIVFAWLAALVTVIPIEGSEDEPSVSVADYVVTLSLPDFWFAYEWLCNSSGVSAGKKLLGVRVQRMNGGAPGIRGGLFRTAGEALGAIPLGLGFWWALRGGEGKTWGDGMAGTRVVRQRFGGDAYRAAHLYAGLSETNLPDPIAPAEPAAPLPASLLRRAFAYLIDSVIIAFVWFAVFAIVVSLAPDSTPVKDSTSPAVWLAFLALPALWFAHQWLCNTRGVSIGKTLLDIRVRRTDGSVPGMKSGLVRTAVQVLGAAAFGIGFLSAIRDQHRLTWADKAANTWVAPLGTGIQTYAAPWAAHGRWAAMRFKYAWSPAVLGPGAVGMLAGLALGFARYGFDLIVLGFGVPFVLGALILQEFVFSWVELGSDGLVLKRGDQRVTISYSSVRRLMVMPDGEIDVAIGGRHGSDQHHQALRLRNTGRFVTELKRRVEAETGETVSLVR